MVDYITIEDRQLLHEATIKLIYLLRGKLEDNEQNGAVIDTNMSRMLFKRLWRAALKCRGFSPSQKDDIIVAAGLDTQISIDHDVPPYAAEWKYLFALGPKPGVPYDMVFVSFPPFHSCQVQKLTILSVLCCLDPRGYPEGR